MDIKWKDRTTGNKLMRIMIVSVNFIYTTIYYYYLPFLTNFVPYFFAEDM